MKRVLLMSIAVSTVMLFSKLYAYKEVSVSSAIMSDNVSMFMNKNSVGLSKNIRNNFSVKGDFLVIPYSIGNKYTGINEVSGLYSQFNLSSLYNIGNLYLGGGVSGNDIFELDKNFSFGFNIIAAYGYIFNNYKSVIILKPYFEKERIISSPVAVEYEVFGSKPGINVEFKHNNKYRLEADYSLSYIEVEGDEILLDDLYSLSYEDGNTISSIYALFQVLRVWDILNPGVSFAYSTSKISYNQIVNQQVVINEDDNQLQPGVPQRGRNNQQVTNSVEYSYAYIPIYTPKDDMSLNFHISNEPLKGVVLSAKIPLWSSYTWQARNFEGASQKVSNTAAIEIIAQYQKQLSDKFDIAVSAQAQNKAYSSFGYFTSDSYTSFSAGMELKLQL